MANPQRYTAIGVKLLKITERATKNSADKAFDKIDDVIEFSVDETKINIFELATTGAKSVAKESPKIKECVVKIVGPMIEGLKTNVKVCIDGPMGLFIEGSKIVFREIWKDAIKVPVKFLNDIEKIQKLKKTNEYLRKINNIK